MLAFYKGFDLTYSWNNVIIVRGGDQGDIKLSMLRIRGKY